LKTLQRTLAIIKPDAVAKNVSGDIIKTIEEQGFRIIGVKMLHLKKAQAGGFYAVHVGKPFYDSLVQFMTSGTVVVMALEKENAIADWRKLMGATNPANAEPGTIRKKHAESIERNAVHGSDAEDTARFELSFFFAGYELAK
jgi:nucleoside-diphosphate kinase